MSILQMQTVTIHFYNTNHPFDRYKNARNVTESYENYHAVSNYTQVQNPWCYKAILFYLALFWTAQWYCNIPGMLYSLTQFFNSIWAFPAGCLKDHFTNQQPLMIYAQTEKHLWVVLYSIASNKDSTQLCRQGTGLAVSPNSKRCLQRTAWGLPETCAALHLRKL